MTWILNTLSWYVYLLIIGIIFLPLTARVFKKFSFDLAYPFAKVIGIILLSYSIYLLGIIKIIPFDRAYLFFIIGIFIVINGYIYLKDKKSFNLSNLSIFLIEEFLFLGCLLFWAFIRSQEPSIRSLEKFMDFGFMKSILRSEFFPPKDIWYTPLSINYYYFGHLTGAFLIKLSNIYPAIGYNLILATIFAQGVTQVFSLITNVLKLYIPTIKKTSLMIFGVLGAYMVNLGGNLHTIYSFTTGYPNEEPVPFWKILSGFNPLKYWYPNATRFIPFTIHEFPSYSYVVADLHGHVFDIPFILLTIALLFLMFISIDGRKNYPTKQLFKFKSSFLKEVNDKKSQLIKLLLTPSSIFTISLGFLTAVHYMTNAFDGPIYILLIMTVLFFIFKLSFGFFFNVLLLIISFVVFSLPFSINFSPFVSGIGVNCSPDFLVTLGKLGPFIFEKGNCQVTSIWMFFILWGFFLISLVIFLINIFFKKDHNPLIKKINIFLLILFLFGLFLIIIPEFFYIKDIYPTHFRANTMFKLGYQAFMMMGFGSMTVFAILKQQKTIKNILSLIIFSIMLMLVFIYPYFSIPSYYGNLDRKPSLDGSSWLLNEYPEDKEIIDYLNTYEKGQPVILEAQGDSYTDYERISAFTGLPTVAGWWVHEWLWRGSSDIIGDRIPEVIKLYESLSIEETKELITKYKIKYVVVSRLEKQKYPNLNEDKFKKIGKLVFKSTNLLGALYELNSAPY